MPNTFNEMETTTELSISCGCVPSCARFGLCFGHCFGLCQCCHRSRAAKAPLRDARANESSRSLTPSSSSSSSSCSSYIWLLYLAVFLLFLAIFAFRIWLANCGAFSFHFVRLFSTYFLFSLRQIFVAFHHRKLRRLSKCFMDGGNGEVLGRFQLNRANRWLNYLFANAKFSAKLFAQLI